MNLKVYEKTRYQNIYRHKKNKNYIIMMSKPVKTSISTIDGKKIIKIEDAINIRDNPKIKKQKEVEVIHKEEFDNLYLQYLNFCKYEKKLAFNTIKKKKNLYRKYLKDKFSKVSKITKNDMIKFFNELECSDKQKNEIMVIIRSFFNWCLENDILIVSPMKGIKDYRVTKTEMKYWLPEHLTKILTILNEDISCENVEIKKKAYLVKMIVLIGFSLGDRIGESRALQFGRVSEEFNTIQIKYSINYDTKDENYLVVTKTESSDDVLYVTPKLIKEILEYKNFLINELGYNVDDNTPIFVNISTDKPYSDTNLRKHFDYYIKKASVPRIRMYDLRHTLATTLMSENYDMYDIQDRLRHKSIRTTIDQYGHITLQKRKKVADATDKYI